MSDRSDGDSAFDLYREHLPPRHNVCCESSQRIMPKDNRLCGCVCSSAVASPSIIYFFLFPFPISLDLFSLILSPHPSLLVILPDEFYLPQLGMGYSVFPLCLYVPVRFCRLCAGIRSILTQCQAWKLRIHAREKKESRFGLR